MRRSVAMIKQMLSKIMTYHHQANQTKIILTLT